MRAPRGGTGDGAGHGGADGRGGGVRRDAGGLFHRDVRRWSPDEDRALTAALARGGMAAALEAFPGWAEERIRRRAKRMGTSVKAKGAKGADWTGADLVRLARLWPLRPKAEIEAAFPGRTWEAITSRAAKIGSIRQGHVRKPLPASPHPLLDAVRLRMLARAFTATDLQECAGIKRGIVSSWFAGRAEPKLRNVERAAEALGGRLVIVWDDEG